MDKTPTMNAPNPYPQGAPQQSGSSFPWGKVLAGCGCLTFLALIGAGVAGWLLYEKAADKLGEEFESGRLAEVAEEAELGEESQKRAGAEGNGDIRKRMQEQKEEALDSEKIRDYAREPLTQKDIRAYREFVEDWRSESAYKNWQTQWKNMEEMGKTDDESVAGKLRAARQVGKTMQAVRDVMEAYDKHVKEHGGYAQHFGRVVRIGGAVAAADQIAKSHKLDDANTDKVAGLMLEERPEIAEEYQKNLAEARKAAKQAKEKGRKGDMAAYQGLMTLAQGPGTIALAVMPEQSFETWEALSAKEREELRESLGESIAPGPWFGLMQVNPAVILTSAYMAELKEFSPK